ncbi:MAG: MaoC family dehydratase N-terminal domain-containing protein [Chloroflexota bacterium]
MTTTQTFEEAIAEYLERTRQQIGQESVEQLPPLPPCPYEQAGPRYESAFQMDSSTIQKYTLGIGDDNPLYMDPEYGKHTRYGCQIAPGQALAWVRYPAVHGVRRKGGYPVGSFFSGTAWEFYDVIRVGSRFRSSKVTKEVVEKQGSRGRLLFLITELYYWDYHGDLPAKCYGTLTMVPQETMGATRAMSVERLGEKMLYGRGAHKYNREEIDEMRAAFENSPKRRGAEALYWEDVQVGEKLGPFMLPPWSHQDHMAPQVITSCNTRDPRGEAGDAHTFEPAYHQIRKWAGRRIHPVTRWPWNSGGIEHDDALLAAYRGMPGPFDSGVQRVQIPQKVLRDWMGDDGFIRRMYTGMRRPVFYADSSRYAGEVVKKFVEIQRGEKGQGAVPGKAKYYAVGIKLMGTNQTGDAHIVGTATVYLPSREGGPVELPVPHPAQPPYIPFETFCRDWY